MAQSAVFITCSPYVKNHLHPLEEADLWCHSFFNIVFLLHKKSKAPMEVAVAIQRSELDKFGRNMYAACVWHAYRPDPDLHV